MKKCFIFLFCLAFISILSSCNNTSEEVVTKIREEQVSENQEKQLDLYRNFREDFLTNTDFGRKFHHLLYRNGGRVVQLMQEDSELASDIFQLVPDLMSICNNLVNEKGSQILDLDILERVDATLLKAININKNIAEKVVEERERLVQDIQYLRNKVDIKSFVGQSVASVWKTVKEIQP